MSKSEILHELYDKCKDINFDDTYNLMKDARTKEEADFFNVVTDFILQQKQKKAIEEKRF